MRSTERSSCWRVLLATAAVLVLTATISTSIASAGTQVPYCSGFAAGSYDTCTASRHHIYNNEVTADYAVCAGAFLDNNGAVGAFYGSYNCGSRSASHAYSNSQYLHAAVHNHVSFFNVLNGFLYY